MRCVTTAAGGDDVDYCRHYIVQLLNICSLVMTQFYPKPASPSGDNELQPAAEV